jgi:general secretion pathway protein M
MVSAIKRSPLVQKINSAYDHLPRRDQRAVQLLSVALAAFIVYFLIWQPAQEFHDDAAARADAAVERMAWLESNIEEARHLAQQGRSSGPTQQIQDSRSMMSTVTVSAQEAGLSLQRFEPSGEDQMRVWLDNTAFDSLAQWLERLAAEYGIVVDQASIDRADEAGRVNVRLTLSL